MVYLLIAWWFSMAMLNNQMVLSIYPENPQSSYLLLPHRDILSHVAENYPVVASFSKYRFDILKIFLLDNNCTILPFEFTCCCWYHDDIPQNSNMLPIMAAYNVPWWLLNIFWCADDLNCLKCEMEYWTNILEYYIYIHPLMLTILNISKGYFMIPSVQTCQ